MGHSVIDGAKVATLNRIWVVHMNQLNQFEAVKSSNDEKLAILLAISKAFGSASPAALNPNLVIPDDSSVNQLASAIESRLQSNPDDFIISNTMSRFRKMNERLTVYGEYLKELSEKGNGELNISERQRIKAELGYLETRIKLDRDHLKSSTDTDLIIQSNENSKHRAWKYADQSLDAIFN